MANPKIDTKKTILSVESPGYGEFALRALRKTQDIEQASSSFLQENSRSQSNSVEKKDIGRLIINALNKN